MIAKESEAGPVLVAYVVAGSKPQLPTPHELRSFLHQSLPEYMLPAQFVFLEQLPLTSNGKVDCRLLRNCDPKQLSIVPTYQPATNDIERSLVAIWEADFNLQPIGIDDDFFSLGGNSLLAAGLVAQIDEQLGRQIAFDELLEKPTIRQLAEWLEAPQPTRESPLVVIQCGSSSRPTLFCLPCLGSSLLVFRNLAQQLGPNYTVFGFRPPGVDGRQTPYTDIVEMARDYIESLRTRQPDGPYYLAGYSFGGVVAFEMALQLEAQGQSVGLLALVDSWLNPSGSPLRERIADHWKLSAQQKSATRWGYMAPRLRAKMGTLFKRAKPRTDEEQVLEMDIPPAHFDVAVAHLRAWKSYRPKKIYHGTLTLFTADSILNADGRTADEWSIFRDRHFGWSRWTRTPIDACEIPGTHMSILNSTNVQALANSISGRIDKFHGSSLSAETSHS